MLTKACVALPTTLLVAHDHMLGSLTAVVDGKSMSPTFNTGSSESRDRIVLNRMFRQLGRGDVVVLRSPNEEGQLLIKRVIGMEGDSIPLRSGNSFVVPRGQVWVEGDNKVVSRDSRRFGPVDLELVEARVALKVWPLREAGAIPSADARPRAPFTERLAAAYQEGFAAAI